MASITTEPNGRRSIQFLAGDGKRRTVRLGKVSQRQAEAVKVKIEDLAAASITGHVPQRETAKWLTVIPDDLHERIAAVGLCEPRGATKLGAFIEDFMEKRCDVKAGTRVHWSRQKRYLLEYFGADKPLRAITEGDADGYRLHLLKTLSANTVGRACGVAKQLMRVALRRRLIDSNPFEEVKTSVGRNEERMQFVSRPVADKVLAAAPDASWRLLLALARFGGLRIPSEAAGLRWSDIDWEHSRITVTSPKTAHQGKPTRTVPMFPELRPYLLEAFEAAADGADFIFDRRLDSAVNLRTHLLRIIKRAGVEPWPKLWQNLRATRATELADVFPSHVCAAWLGHTEKVADKHYRSTTDAHFERAASMETSAVQNPVQQAHAIERMPAHGEPTNSGEPALAGVSCGSDADIATAENKGDGLGRIRTDV